MRSNVLKACASICLGAALLTTTPGLGQPAEEDPSEQTTRENTGKPPVEDKSATTPQKTAQNSQTRKPQKKKPGDIFRPSEEISEDYAVPFPVDI